MVMWIHIVSFFSSLPLPCTSHLVLGLLQHETTRLKGQGRALHGVAMIRRNSLLESWIQHSLRGV